MFGATILVPTLTGLPVSVALFASGIGTLIYTACTKGKVPVYLGSSFAYISAVQIAIAALGGNPSAAQTGLMLVGLILGIGRAFGEATAVAMVAGNKMFGPTLNLFDTTRTLTTTMLAGLGETTGLDYDIRFSAGLVLMAVILFSNLILNLVKKKVGNIQ